MASQFRRAGSGGMFKADVDEIIAATTKRMNALMRASLSDVIDNAQLAVGKGGRMRVDTGFLRASGQASLLGLPTGPSMKPTDAKPNSIPYDTDAATVILGQLQVGQTFYYGWTANYAKYREVYDGFLEGAVQRWPQIVAFNAEAIKQRIKK